MVALMPPLQILTYLIFSIGVFSQTIPATHFELNHRFHLKTNEAQSKSDGAAGFSSVFEGPDLEVQARGTQIQDENAATQMCEVQFANIQNIFAARRNPYEGQITDVITCDKTLKPRPFSFKVGGKTVKGVLAGANGRKVFGACSYDQLEYWSSYFNFYDPVSQFVLEFRVFSKIKGAKHGQINKLSDKLIEISRDLLQARDSK